MKISPFTSAMNKVKPLPVNSAVIGAPGLLLRPGTNSQP